MTDRDQIEPMSPEELVECLDVICWRTSNVAYLLDVEPRVVTRWATGVREVPRYVGHWVRCLRAAHEAFPLPEGWRTGDEKLRVDAERRAAQAR